MGKKTGSSYPKSNKGVSKASAPIKPANGDCTTIAQKSVYRSPNATTLEILVRKVGEAPNDKRFVLNDGRVLKNLVELSHALEHMSDDVFNHHLNASKNDFRNWVKDVFNQKELAAELEKAKTRSELQLAVLKHIVNEMFS